MTYNFRAELDHFRAKVDLTRFAISNLNTYGVDPRGSRYALGLVRKADRLSQLPNIRWERAEDNAREVESWLKERGIVIDNNYSREPFLRVSKRGIRQPLSLREELHDCALELPLMGAMLTAAFVPIGVAEGIKEMRSDLHKWRDLSMGKKANLVGGALACLASPVLVIICIAAAILFLTIGPLAGSVVALGRYSRGRAESVLVD